MQNGIPEELISIEGIEIGLWVVGRLGMELARRPLLVKNGKEEFSAGGNDIFIAIEEHSFLPAQQKHA